MPLMTVNELCRKYIKPHMIQEYQERTFKHIKLVKYLGVTVDREFKFKGSLANQVSEHDSDKLKPPLLQAHILSITKHMAAIQKRYDVEYPPEVERAIQMSVYFHVTESRHHPEFWDRELNFSKISVGNYMPDVKINAHAMPDISLAEMCCDWVAVSAELSHKKDAVLRWANRVFVYRFDFTEDQQRFIYDVLHFLISLRKGDSFYYGEK